MVTALSMKGLFRRYVATHAGLVTLAVLLVGTTLALYHYFQDSKRAEQIQRAEARAASAAIESYLRGIERTLRSLAARGQEGSVASRAAQAADFRQALKFQPAIMNIRAVDADAMETNFVSRVDPDQADSHLALPAVKAIMDGCSTEFCYGTAFVRDETEPYLRVVVRAPFGSESLAAELSLRFLDDILSKLNIQNSGLAYVVDGNDHLLAHPDLRTLLWRADVADLPQVRAVRESKPARDGILPSSWGTSPDGGAVFASATRIEGPAWLVFVEQPKAMVLSTVRTTIWVMVLVLLLSIAAAWVASMLLARRLTLPILKLRDGAERLGAGDLSAKIEIHSHDEIQSVASTFNQMAESLRSLYDSLEAKVEARTRDLAEANVHISKQAAQLSVLNERLGVQLNELNAKREEADRASAAKSRFVAAASHDLRQPMHAVALLVGILADRQNSPELSALLSRIQLSVSALESLLGTLLDISRLDAGIVRPNLACVSIGSLLESVELAHLQSASEKGLALKIAKTRTMVMSDAALLMSILGNLVSNAVRYTERGQVEVFCHKRGGHLELHVADSGIGIAEDQLERVFDEFYRIGTERAEGLGLGLAIVKKTAELLNHTVVARSRVGVGSVFSVRLPIAELHQIGQILPTPEEVRDAQLVGAFVVVVDDDEEIRFATEAVFKSWHCHVISGASGRSVREALAQHLRQPDLIVADLRLSAEETGLNVVQALRADAELPVPAIILSADQDTDMANKVRAQGMVFLQKPVNPHRLRRTAIELLLQSYLIEHQVVSPR